ncbi:MAG TPA: class I SAM-dependent methyltransferase [Thermoanaerobaculia bacterium]|nr:class I SAM-dependent methyltransferase [Thermoanaerobaculia bacterium]
MNRIASRYPTRLLRSYAQVKIATDPAYNAVFELLRDTTDPLLDIGCGVGLLDFYLRHRGVQVPILGIDHDRRKIEIARRVANDSEDLSFDVRDAREPFAFRGNVVLLDLLHYFSHQDQSRILRNVACAGGMIIIRDGIRDGSLRYRLTYAQETLARMGGWLKAERLCFPTRETIEDSLNGEFREEVRPMFGHTPFNNYLFVFKRASAGMMNP